MDRDAFDKLTERQKQCLRMVAAGKRSKTIGATLGISHLTVNQHIEAAKARIGTATREQAAEILIAYERGEYPEGVTSEPRGLAEAAGFDRIGASSIPDDALPQRSVDMVMEAQAAYRATGVDFDDLLRLPLRTRERPRNDLSAFEILLAVVKLIILLAVGAIAVAAIVETMTKIGTNLR